MSAQPSTPSNEDVLVQRVTFPTFFEKIASTPYAAHTQEQADELIKLAQVVGLAVGAAVDRELKALDAQSAYVVKGAAEAALNVAGANKPAPDTGTKSAAFLEDPAISAAVRGVVAEQIKKAGLGAVMPGVTVPTASDEDEEEKEKKTAPQ